MATSKTYDEKPESQPNKLPEGATPGTVSQRQLYSHTGKIKTPAEAGDKGKCSTKYPW
jgi:hypothetical protein